MEAVLKEQPAIVEKSTSDEPDGLVSRHVNPLKKLTAKLHRFWLKLRTWIWNLLEELLEVGSCLSACRQAAYRAHAWPPILDTLRTKASAVTQPSPAAPGVSTLAEVAHIRCSSDPGPRHG